MMNVCRESVGDIDATRRDANEFHSEIDFRFRIEIATNRRLREFALRIRQRIELLIYQRESRRRSAERTTDVQPIAGARAAAQDRILSLADRGHRGRQL